MEDNLNFLEILRRPQFLCKMEDSLNCYNKMEDILKFLTK
jgi:hypothetical protein